MAVDQDWRALSTRQVQVVLLDMLLWLDDLCSQNGIQYWIDAGTLLGAVRHGGFIPWDDDIDVAMPREDYERFLAVVDSALRDGLSHERRPADLVAVNSKISLEGTSARDLYGSMHGYSNDSIRFSLDVFVHDHAHDAKAVRFTESRLAFATAVKPWAKQLAHSPAKMSHLKRLRWEAISLIPKSLAVAIQDRLVARSRKRDSSWNSCALDTPYAIKAYPKAAIFPLSEITFEGVKVPAPHAPHEYLRHHFGPDYMTPPPADKRRTHLEDPQATTQAMSAWGLHLGEAGSETC